MRYISIILVLFMFAFSSCSSGSDNKSTSTMMETTEKNSEESIKDIKESVETSNEIFSDTDSPDWNELLDSYEQYVDQYISYVKKAANGDMDALAEYPSLMQKAQEFSDKMKGAQSDMSASQWSRYMKITNKMTNALQELK